MRMKRSLTTALAAALVLLAGGCISSERMWRNSPAGSGDIRVRFDNQTVNLWPLYYHNDDFTSALWPVFDVDSRGFALRPFYCQEEDEASFLWPLSGWDSGGGWALNSVWGDHLFAVIPLFIWDWGEIVQLGPVLNLSGEIFVFPAAWWKTSFQSWYFGPAWKNRDDWGVFPVAWFVNNYRVIGPAWWRPADRLNWGVFPIVWFTDDYRVIGPAWWRENGDEKGFFPLAGHFPNGFYHIGPMWWQDGTHGFFPLYEWEKKRNGFGLTIGYPLLKIEQSDAGSSGHMLWPIVNWETRRGDASWRIWPLISCDDSDWFSPILHINTWIRRENSGFFLPNGSYTPFGKNFSFGEEMPCNVQEYTKSWFGAFLAFHESGAAHVWKTDDPRRELRQLENTLRSLFWKLEARKSLRNDAGAEEREKAETDVAEARQELAQQLARLAPDLPVPENPEELESLARTLVERFCREVDYFEHRTLGGLSSWYERFGDDYWGQFGFGAVFLCKYRDKSDFRILGFLYREKQDGESSEYLYPLFLNVKKAPGRCAWSFLYRVFHYENDNGRKSGHIFFIPWGGGETEGSTEKQDEEASLPAGAASTRTPKNGGTSN